MTTATKTAKPRATKTKTETEEISPLRAYRMVSKAYEEAKKIGDNALLKDGTFDTYILFEGTFRQCLIERIERAGLASTPWGASRNDVDTLRATADLYWAKKCLTSQPVKS
jgi:hypothetical protein